MNIEVVLKGGIKMHLPHNFKQITILIYKWPYVTS